MIRKLRFERENIERKRHQEGKTLRGALGIKRRRHREGKTLRGEDIEMGKH